MPAADQPEQPPQIEPIDAPSAPPTPRSATPNSATPNSSAPNSSAPNSTAPNSTAPNSTAILHGGPVKPGGPARLHAVHPRAWAVLIVGSALSAMCAAWIPLSGELKVEPVVWLGMVLGSLFSLGLAWSGALWVVAQMYSAAADDVWHYGSGASGTLEADVRLVSSPGKPRTRVRQWRPLALNREDREIATVPVPARDGSSNGSVPVLLADGQTFQLRASWSPHDGNRAFDRATVVISFSAVVDRSDTGPAPVIRAAAFRGLDWQQPTRSAPRSSPSAWLDWIIELPGHTFRLRTPIGRLPARRTLLDTHGQAWRLSHFESAPQVRITVPDELADPPITFLLLLEVLIAGLVRAPADALDEGLVDRPLLRDVLMDGWQMIIPPAY